MLEINATLIVQIIAYFVLLYLLNRLLFKPVMAVIEKRREKTEGTLKGAADIEKEVEEGLEAYRERLKDETAKAQEARAAIKKAAVEKEKALLDSARKEAQDEITRMKAELEKGKGSALESLKEESKKLSTTIAEKVLERKLASIAIAFMLPLLPAMAFGSAGGEEGHTGMYWKVFNFILLAGGLYLIWAKWLKGALEGRSKDIQCALEEAHRTRAEAEAKLKEYQQKLALLDQKVAQIRTDLKVEAGEEKKKILEEAENAAIKIKGQAKRTAEQEVKKAKLELQKEVARLAVEMAKEILAEQIKPEDQKRLAKDYVDKLSLG